MEYLILILACALSLVVGFHLGSTLHWRAARQALDERQAKWEARERALMEANQHLVGKITGMQRAGFMAVPDEPGEVWQITPDYERDVERRRRGNGTDSHGTPAEG